MSKVKRISVSNLKALSAKSIDFNGCTAIVTGGNDKGKSSFLRSLMDRLRKMKPDRILKEGEREGFYEMELTTGETFKWNFNDKGAEKLTFITEKNIKSSVTKDISAYYFPSVFDIDKFLEMQPAKQKSELEKIAGIDFTELNRQLKGAQEERTYQNRLVVESQARLETVFTNLPTEIDKSFETIDAEIQSANLYNEQLKNFKFKVDSKQVILDANKKDIVQLKVKIKLLEDANMELETDIDKGNNYLAAKPLKTPDFISDLKEKAEKIKEDNKKIEENNKAIALQKVYEKAVENAQVADNNVKSFEKDKIDAIKNCANLPEGFGFSDDGITYNNLAYDRQSQSSSAIYIGALKLAAIGLGEVRTLYFDASLLDKNNLKKIEEWSSTQGLQLLIERPSFEGGEIEYELIEE